MVYFLEEPWKKETFEIFLLSKYINALQMAIVDIAAVLYVVHKYLFALSLDSPFLWYILLCILGKWQHKLMFPQLREFFKKKVLITRLNWYKDGFKRWRGELTQFLPQFLTSWFLCCDPNLYLLSDLPRLDPCYCVKSVRICSYSGTYFPVSGHFFTQCGS